MRKYISKIVSAVGTPVFIYDEKVLSNNIRRIFNAADKFNLRDRIKTYIAYFANSNPHLFKTIQDDNVGILLQSKEEYSQVKKFGLVNDIVISPSFLSDEEIDFWMKEKVVINLASLEEIKYFVNKFNTAPSFRIDLTQDSKQRTAIKEYQLEDLAQFLRQKNITPRSFHVYVGTGSSLVKMKNNFVKIIEIYKKYFPNTKEINLGGGFAFEYDSPDPKKKHFNWENYFQFISKKISEANIPKDIKFILEPGRDVFADVGSLVVSITRIVNLKDKKNIGTDGSYVFMPSATIRKRQHALIFLNNNFEELNNPNVVGALSGCTTLSSDYLFPGEVKIPANLQAGDYIVVQDIGAYGATQHMEFLNKKPCPEVLIKENGDVYLLTERGEDDDKIRYLLSEPKKI